MQLNDAGQQLATRPAPNPTVSPGWFNNAPATSPPTIVDADFLNAVQAELLQFLTLTGQAASKLAVNQVAAGALMLFGCYGIDTGGTANQYVVAPSLALPALQDGQPVRFWTTRANTGAATLTLSPLSAQPIVYANGGGALAANTIVVGVNTVYWNAGLGAFVVPQLLVASGLAAITANGTFTVPAGVSRAYVRLWGAGGGGGGSSTTSGSGGGGGGYSEGLVSGLTAGGTIAVTVGAGGAGGSSAGNGGNGGSTSFGSYLSATGGLGGNAGSGGNASGGTGTGGAFNATGLTGDFGYNVGSGYINGPGGGTFGSPGFRGGISGVGQNAVLPGVGGNGAAVNGSTQQAGGNGANGLILVRW